MEFHKFMAVSQRRAYNEQRASASLLKEGLVIVMDFKAAYDLGYKNYA